MGAFYLATTNQWINENGDVVAPPVMPTPPGYGYTAPPESATYTPGDPGMGDGGGGYYAAPGNVYGAGNEPGTQNAPPPPGVSPPSPYPCCVTLCRLADQPSGGVSQPSTVLDRGTYATGGTGQVTTVATTLWETTAFVSQTACWVMTLEVVIKDTAPASGLGYYVLFFDRLGSNAIANNDVALRTYGPIVPGGYGSFASKELVELGGVAPFYGDPYDYGVTAKLSTTPRFMTAPAGDYMAVTIRIRNKP